MNGSIFDFIFKKYNDFFSNFVSIIIYQMNSACTFGAWHPLAAEKLMTYDMNTANDFSTFQNGVIRIRKPKTNGCS